MRVVQGDLVMWLLPSSTARGEGYEDAVKSDLEAAERRQSNQHVVLKEIFDVFVECRAAPCEALRKLHTRCLAVTCLTMMLLPVIQI